MDDNLPVLLIRKINRLNRQHKNLISLRVSDPNAHRTRHLILRYLKWSGTPLSQRELAEKFEVSPPAMAMILKKLEAAGLIARCSSPKDARIKLVSITEKGEESIRSQKQFFTEMNNAMIRGIPPEDLDTLARVLDQMSQNLLEVGAADPADPLPVVKEMREHPRED